MSSTPTRSGSTARLSLPPTGKVISLRIIDILTLDGGKISDIVMVADELGGLAAVGAATLIPSDQAGG